MASENWKTVGDFECNVFLQKITEPESKNSPCTKFVMDMKALVRRCVLRQQPVNMDDDISLFLGEENWSEEKNETEIEIESNNPCDMDAAAMSQALTNNLLQVPLGDQKDIMIDMILRRAFELAKEYGPHKVVHLAVDVDVYVVPADWDLDNRGGSDFLDAEDDQPAFVPASREEIEKLERTRVEVLSMCSVCIDEIKVGSEATQMPCLHLYHEGCIVEWLQTSRVCPMCRYSFA